MLAILLDAGPLGLISNPQDTESAVACREWAITMHSPECTVYVPEIADYEVRRELLRARKFRGLQRLDKVKSDFEYLIITTELMLRAAQLWADARNAGVPTADRHALDGDVILCAQANILIDAGIDVVIASDNAVHLSRFAPAARWQDIQFAP